jgi:hypothetical protein
VIATAITASSGRNLCTSRTYRERSDRASTRRSIEIAPWADDAANAAAYGRDRQLDQEAHVKILTISVPKTMLGTAVLGAVLLAAGYPFRDDGHGVRWVLGGIGWFGFLLCMLALIVLALVALGRSVFRRAAA